MGGLSDRIGRVRLLIAGYALYAVVYGSFGFVGRSSARMLWMFWILYGIYYALTEGVEKAFVADLAPGESKATALGLNQTIEGVGLLLASLLAGGLFSLAPSAPFIFGAITSLAAVMILSAFPNQRGARGAGGHSGQWSADQRSAARSVRQTAEFRILNSLSEWISGDAGT
jgi:MFS family permease